MALAVVIYVGIDAISKLVALGLELFWDALIDTLIYWGHLSSQAKQAVKRSDTATPSMLGVMQDEWTAGDTTTS